jgi:hypothetical protein
MFDNFHFSSNLVGFAHSSDNYKSIKPVQNLFEIVGSITLMAFLYTEFLHYVLVYSLSIGPSIQIISVINASKIYTSTTIQNNSSINKLSPEFYIINIA